MSETDDQISKLKGVTAEDVEAVERNVVAEIQREAVRVATEERQSRLAEFDTEIYGLQESILRIEKELQEHSEIWKERNTKERELGLLRKKLASAERKRDTFEEAADARDALRAVPALEESGTFNASYAKDKQANEVDTDFLIRTGRITPFQSGFSSGRAPKRRRLNRKAHTTSHSERRQRKGHGISEIAEGDFSASDQEESVRDTDYVSLADVDADDEESPGNDGSEKLTETAEEGEEEVVLHGGLRIPAAVYDNLFDYQKTGVQWLWELHCQECGGIIGDEMGLGKTIQVIAFLAALSYSGKLSGPVIIVAPTTVLQQWRREFNLWAPGFRIRILHHSVGNGEHTSHDNFQSTFWSAGRTITEAVRDSFGVLITSYEQVRKHHKRLLNAFEYVILDEGHKIRNPDAAITLVCKQFDTPHRIIMSGSPLQNNLKELWSLFDFVFPGKLGTLPVFEEQFSVPIAVGGYVSASKSQVHTAYKCAVVLKDLVSPYLLRRLKKDVALQLPKKNEQILFCRLTIEQRLAYENYVASQAVRKVLSGQMNLLAAISVLRKICNHPDIVSESDSRKVREAAGRNPMDVSKEHGSWEKSGKLRILNRILPMWHKDGSRVLLFSQTRTMLDVVELFVKDRGYGYSRMDGETAIGRRMSLIDEFNSDASIFLFLLTTKVGGLGVNLTGADRVVIIDPDWNPATDLQARERAWRIGQTRPVSIYRLITSGTIEEKMYHRQIYKQFLSNKVLSDPRQRRFFKPKQLRDLFALGSEDDAGTETGDLFAGTKAQEKLEFHHQEGREEHCQENGIETPMHGDSASSAPKQNVRAKGDAALLKDLFDNPEGSGIHSAMDHDEIVNAATSGVDLKLMDSEAEKVASKAAEELARSRDQRLRQGGVAVPTWTGLAGVAGVPQEKPRIGAGASLEVSGLLKRIREREGGTAKGIGSTLRNRSLDSPIGKESSRTGAEMMSSIIHFLRSSNGRATTAVVVEKFRDRVGTAPSDLALFKAMLKKVATLRKAGVAGGASMWILKALYRSSE